MIMSHIFGPPRGRYKEFARLRLVRHHRQPRTGDHDYYGDDEADGGAGAAAFRCCCAAAEAAAQPLAPFSSDMEVVYDWDRDHCPVFPPMPPANCVPDIQPGCDGDNVDSMPRAWADLSRGGYRMLGNVATDQGPSRPQIGPRLDALRHSCSPYTTVVPPDPALAHMGGDVWVEAPFVLNKTHVYALTHVDQYNATIH